MSNSDAFLTIAISSSALFDLSESHRVWETLGEKEYAEYQQAHEHTPLLPGTAFSFVQKVLALKDPKTDMPLVEVVLLSRNSSETGLRVFNSIHAHKLPITRAAFTRGTSPDTYLEAFCADLFLSKHADDVKNALNKGIAAACLYDKPKRPQEDSTLRVAFDGDSVLFSDEAEAIYQTKGLDAFQTHETTQAHVPLMPGPFKGFLTGLHHIQSQFPAGTCPIRTALVTARHAPAHERAIRTLRAWDIRVDETFFLGGFEKTAFLSAFHADIFFDDHPTHCEKADVPTGHVLSGIVNRG